MIVLLGLGWFLIGLAAGWILCQRVFKFSISQVKELQKAALEAQAQTEKIHDDYVTKMAELGPIRVRCEAAQKESHEILTDLRRMREERTS